ncbi:hypothetical protein tinsulaeT_25350 [Thalassotalea insulae]|uniref:YcaO domain-containing protein n=1 Tax=Thalassotalea insulae TaxID=2056778 RepID=A0ABQ6GXE5_9GAMM|nr:YcaO-like family protein [Thalassotalea insulae]GLX79195.1 hypothetical protein tinsulaeT_25350 [Thalassotalea insulae]
MYFRQDLDVFIFHQRIIFYEPKTDAYFDYTKVDDGLISYFTKNTEFCINRIHKSGINKTLFSKCKSKNSNAIAPFYCHSIDDTTSAFRVGRFVSLFSKANEQLEVENFTKFISRKYEATIIKLVTKGEGLKFVSSDIFSSSELRTKIHGIYEYEFLKNEFVKPFNSIVDNEENYWSVIFDDIIDTGVIKPYIDHWIIRNKEGDILSHFAAASHKLITFSDDADETQFGTGISGSEAVSKATIEGYERYCSRLLPDDIIKGSEKFLKKKNNVINIDNLVSYTEAQNIKWNVAIKEAHEERSWVKVKSFEGETYLCPLEMVYYGDFDGNSICTRSISSSSGIAAHTSIEEATKSALLELIERDALLRHWYSNTPPPKLKIDDETPFTSAVRNILSSVNISLNVFVLHMGLFPTYLAIGISEDESYKFSSGASCNPCSIEAIDKAVSEVFICMSHKILNSKINIELIDDKAHIKTPQDHGKFYFSGYNFNKISHFFENSDTYPKSDFSNSLENILSKTRENGIKLYYRELHPKDINEYSNRIKVIRVISEGLIPITFGYQAEPLGMSCIRNIINEAVEKEILAGDIVHFFA